MWFHALGGKSAVIDTRREQRGAGHVHFVRGSAFRPTFASGTLVDGASKAPLETRWDARGNPRGFPASAIRDSPGEWVVNCWQIGDGFTPTRTWDRLFVSDEGLFSVGGIQNSIKFAYI